MTGNITASREIAINVTKFSPNYFGDPEPAANALIARSGQKGSGDFKKNKNSSSRFCDHCQRSGHTTEQCFKIVSYPNWYQGPKEGTKPRRNFRGNANLLRS